MSCVKNTAVYFLATFNGSSSIYFFVSHYINYCVTTYIENRTQHNNLISLVTRWNYSEKKRSQTHKPIITEPENG